MEGESVGENAAVQRPRRLLWMIASLVACAHTRARAVAVCALVADARSTTWLCRSMPTAPCTRRGVCDSNWLLSVDGPLPPPQLSPRGGSFPTPFQRRACRRAAAVAALNNGLLRLGAKMQVRPVEPKQSLGIAALVRARIDAPLLQAVVDPWMPSCRTLDQCTARPARSAV